MTPATYRRERIENFYHKLRIRRSVLKSQLEQKEFEHMKDFIIGELKAIEEVLAEMRDEFNITDPNIENNA